MATPIVSGLTLINDCETTTNLVSIGGGPGAGTTQDVIKEGDNAIGRRASAGSLRGFGYDISPTIDFTVPGRYLWIWLAAALGPDLLDTIENGGLRIRVSSTAGGGSNYKEFFVGGSNVTDTSWKRYIVDVTKPGSLTNGTPNMAAVAFIGVTTFYPVSAPGGNIPHYVMDAFHYGGNIYVSGGNGSDLVTWEDVRLATEHTSSVWGGIEKKGSIYFVNGAISLGLTGSGDCYFKDENKIVEFNEQKYSSASIILPTLPDDFIGLEINSNPNGTTSFEDGIKIGTGDDAAGANGSRLQKPSGSVNKFKFLANNTHLDTFKIYGTQIGRSDYRTEFCVSPSGAFHELAGVTFDGCTQVIPGSASFRNCTFQGYLTASNASFLWASTSVNIKNSAFRNNSRGIEHSLTGTFTYDGITFAGNTFDIYNSSLTDIVISAVGGSDPTTDLSDSPGTTRIDANVAVTLTDLIAGTEVRVYSGSKSTPESAVEIDGIESSSIDFTFTHNQPGVGAYIQIHKEDYESQTIELTLPSSDTSFPIQQRFDRNYSNP